MRSPAALADEDSATGAACEQNGAGPAGFVSLPRVGFQPRRETISSSGLWHSARGPFGFFALDARREIR